MNDQNPNWVGIWTADLSSVCGHFLSPKFIKTVKFMTQNRIILHSDFGIVAISVIHCTSWFIQNNFSNYSKCLKSERSDFGAFQNCWVVESELNSSDFRRSVGTAQHSVCYFQARLDCFIYTGGQKIYIYIYNGLAYQTERSNEPNEFKPNTNVFGLPNGTSHFRTFTVLLKRNNLTANT